MDFVVTIDWKFAVALGGAAVGTIFIAKSDPNAVERVLNHAVDAFKEFAIATKCSR